MRNLSDSSFSPKEQEVRNGIQSRRRLGLILIISGSALLVPLYLIYGLAPKAIELLLLVAFIVITAIGFIVSEYYGSAHILFFHSLDLIRMIAPDEMTVTSRYGVVRRGPAYILAKWGSNVLTFIAFLHSEPALAPRIKIPPIILPGEYTFPIDSLKVSRREGHFTVPTSENSFISGEGILYSLLIESRSFSRSTSDFSRNQLLRIVDTLNEEATSYGSGRVE